MYVGEIGGGSMTKNDVLLEVTENHLNTGLRGIPVGTCRTSFVTPSEGVHYCGYPIAELAAFEPEDIVYLLFNKELPMKSSLQQFAKTLPHVLRFLATLNRFSKLSRSLAIQWIG